MVRKNYAVVEKEVVKVLGRKEIIDEIKELPEIHKTRPEALKAKRLLQKSVKRKLTIIKFR